MWFPLAWLLGISPRLILFLMWLLSDYLSRAFDSALWPLLGFCFLPWTTLWCAYVYNNGGFGPFTALIAVACVLLDMKSGSGQLKKKSSDQTDIAA